LCLAKCTTFVQSMNILSELYHKKITPLHQVGAILGLQAVLALSFLIFHVEGRNVWMILQAPVLFYTCMTIMVGVFTENVRWYYLFSILGFAIIFTSSIVLSRQASGETIKQHIDFYNVLVLNVLFYFLFLMVSILYKGIKQFIETN
jgi:hypothetical membrane protein